jgi:prepilin-type N-terminal cleavage/methylation domain-containing protein
MITQTTTTSSSSGPLSPRERVRVRARPITSRAHNAFTLVELMISIAMVVILMVGVHQVFKMSSDTIGIGNQVGAMSRDNRSVQQIFHDDFNRLVHDAPLFIIRSGVSYRIPSSGPPEFGAFNTEAERLASRTGDPLKQDLNGNGNEGEPTVPGELTPVSIYNNRNHRIDILGFPARGLFRRATANDGSYTSNLTAQDAFIFYEHLALPPIAPGSNPPRFHAPGEGTFSTNLQNFYSSQWILGRVALLMRDNVPAPDNFIVRQFPPANPPNLSPLRFNSQTFAPPQRFLTQSRFDILGASLETLRQDVADVRSYAGNNADSTASIWWQPLLYNSPTTVPNPVPLAVPLARFECNPRISKPISSASMAQAMPILLNNCSQFIVEFAGDFVTQNNDQTDLNLATGWGSVRSCQPDGIIDFVVDQSNAPAISSRIRWYGLPRDINGDRIIRGFATGVRSNELVDVVPLDDVLRTATGGYIPSAFERELPKPATDYANIPPGDYANFHYTCVFSNSAPSMIRIVLKLEDPSGRLSDGQWFEYVVTAP